ncbi:nuclear transport factor 2 family protein [Oscillatoriales cyanobacterium LEGE 11467]|uniref:Nuclear transport factor 2 family protein n=1 Tax=Zarconia navalis LEGE 11467 TaxID=1828826 RepID=A0A928VTI8_9CYAN|nr:nuclear transport factor 2 family protein [Zarconia navalis]MBE9040084.1 nuclear transport factor 2 family protein [Zarconia navalis LEGE 11467]
MNDSLLNSLADRLKIIETIDGFGMAIDLRDWQKFRSLFADAVEFDYSSIGEVAGTLHPDEIVNTARNDLGGFQATQHMMANHQVNLAGDRATCLAHVRAQHFLPNDRSEPIFEMGGYYTAGLIRINSDWKIQRWKFSVLWSGGNQLLFDLAKQITGDRPEIV